MPPAGFGIGGRWRVGSQEQKCSKRLNETDIMAKARTANTTKLKLQR